MSQPSCDACSNLREYNAQFIMNGVTDTVATSLADDNGFNPCLDELHTDCEDLNDANDCLLGHMDDDVDNFEVCDWKDFMHNLLPNLYEVIKAIIASICGQWIIIHKVQQDICSIAENIVGATNFEALGSWYAGPEHGADVYPKWSFYKLAQKFPVSCDSFDDSEKQISMNFGVSFSNEGDGYEVLKFVGAKVGDHVAYITKDKFIAAGLTDEEASYFIKKTFTFSHSFSKEGGGYVLMEFSGVQKDENTMDIYIHDWVDSNDNEITTDAWFH